MKQGPRTTSTLPLRWAVVPRNCEKPSRWILSLFLCSVTLQSRQAHAFVREKPISVKRPPVCGGSERKGPSSRTTLVCLASAVEEDILEATVTFQKENEHEIPRHLMKESDYPGNFVNVTSTPFVVNGDNVSPSIIHRESIVKNDKTKTSGRRSMWRRRNARTAEEGIRREKLPQLSSLLERAGAMEYYTQSSSRRHYAARTISGLIHALAEEAIDLEVQVDARSDTPLWEKQVDAVEIKFSKLSFKPLRIGGVNEEAGFGDIDGGDKEEDDDVIMSSKTSEEVNMPFLDLSSADEAFDRIDRDNSGALDREEIIRALNMAAGCLEKEPDDQRSEVIQSIANELFNLYDFNGDGVVDRNEYQSLVEDMAALSTTQGERQSNESSGWFSTLFTGTKHYVSSIFRSDKSEKDDLLTERPKSIVQDSSPAPEYQERTFSSNDPTVVDVSDSAEAVGSMAKCLGSITFSGLKLDLRRLAFGGVPILKRITPGGPLILEPFTMTVAGSFSASDIMNSSLIDAGLRQLVSLVLRRRMRSFRDLVDLAVLKGRDWTMASKMAPVTQVTELSSVEFDTNNKMIITGRAKIRTRPGAPTIEQAFKVRVNAGTRKHGRFIRLVEPELAFVLECPKPMEEG